MAARDIYGFLTLSNRLQVHENTIEIAFNMKEDFMQRRKLTDRLWIIKITYLTGRTNKLQRILPRVWFFYIFESVFILIQPHPCFPAANNI